MSFNLSGLFNHSTQMNTQMANTADAAKGSSPASCAGQSASGNALNLPVGSTVSGTIVKVDGSTAYIQMNGEETIQAQLEDSVMLMQGARVTFEVSGMSDGQLILRSLFQNTALQATAEKALMQAGIEINDRSLGMVGEMMKNGLPVDKSTLQLMYRDVVNFPQMSGANIVTMNRLQIPLSEANVAQFQAYMNMEHQIGGAVLQMTDSLFQAFGELLPEDAGKAFALMRQLVDVFGQEMDAQAYAELTSAEGEAQVAQEQQTGEAAGSGTAENIVTDMGGRLPQMSDLGIMAESQNIPREEASYQEALRRIADMQRESGQAAGTDKTGSVPESLSRGMQSLGMNEEAMQKLESGELSGKELLDFVKTAMLEAKDTSDAQMMAKLGQMFQNRDFQTLLKQEIGRQLLMQPQMVADKEEVERYYTRLAEQTNKLSGSLSDILPQNLQAMNEIINLHDNLDFMNQLNQTMGYIQLPLKLQGNNAHGDLYVYTNKKGLANSDGSVSAYLHLDMDHLGPVDVYVALQDKRVSTNFYLKDDEMIDFISRHIDQLNDRLTQKGYQMNTAITKKEKETSVMQEIMEDHKGNLLIGSQSFDVRA